METGTCRLCYQVKELCESHIIPGFLFHRMKRASAIGRIRSSHSPNMPQQDGLKLPWLCKICDNERLQKHETWFANSLFDPLNQGKSVEVSCGPEMLKFAASLVWRAGQYHLEEGLLGHLNPDIRSTFDRALTRWREFLLDKVPHPAEFEVHALHLGLVSGFGKAVSQPPNLNRYLLRAIDFSVAATTLECFVYVKILPFLFIGFVDVQCPEEWNGTKIHVNNGRFGLGPYQVSMSLRDFIIKGARRAGKVSAQISPVQNQRIADIYRKNMDRAAESETMRAMLADVEAFGEDKVFPVEDPGPPISDMPFDFED